MINNILYVALLPLRGIPIAFMAPFMTDVFYTLHSLQRSLTSLTKVMPVSETIKHSSDSHTHTLDFTLWISSLFIHRYTFSEEMKHIS